EETGPRADRDLVAVDPDVLQLGELADVDDQLGRGQPQLHDRQQRVPAREQRGVLAVLLQQGEGPVHGLGARVVESDGDHAELPVEKPGAACSAGESSAFAGSSPAAASTAWTIL